jgi:hypothetical protein
MDDEITAKRRLVLILIIVTVVIFVGLVWSIVTYLPLNLLGLPSPSITADRGRVESNCTHPVAYWKEHPELYPSQVVIGGKVYEEKELAVILSDETQDPAQQLQAQLAGVFLNSLAGADQSSIEATIFEAYGWLVQHPPGSQATDSERETGSRLVNELDAYNMGLTGVAPCDKTIFLTLTARGTATETATAVLSITPSQTNTPTASETPTPTNSPTMPFSTVIYATHTPTPTTEEPGHPSSTPRPTLSPSATNTPVNTKTPPPPTRTSKPTLPPSTPTFTPAPTLPPPTVTP